ncbi:MAG TPA: hypothetical protein VLF20_02690, partial [Patescibacteria group bacterium]|nr:hypothetical protein [Patescibacteria group bacterium]
MKERYPRPIDIEQKRGNVRGLSRLLAEAIHESEPKLQPGQTGKYFEMYTRPIIYLPRKNKEGLIEQRGVFLASRPEWSYDAENLSDELTVIGRNYGLIMDIDTGGKVLRGTSGDDKGVSSVYNKAKELRRIFGEDLTNSAGAILYALASDRREMSANILSWAENLDAISILKSDMPSRELIYFPDLKTGKMLCVDQEDQGGTRKEKILRMRQSLEENNIRWHILDIDRADHDAGQPEHKALYIKITKEGKKTMVKIGEKEMELKEDHYVNASDLDFDVSPLQSPQVLKGLAEIKDAYVNKNGVVGEKDDLALVVGR